MPYVRAVLRAERDPRYRRIVLVCGSQMGKTDSVVANIAGHRLDDDPVPMMYLGPTRHFVDSVFEPRVMALLRSAQSLWRRTLRGKAMTKTKKIVGGVPFRLSWAGSATELAGESVGLAFCDERDRMKEDVAGEGDPGELLETRISTYPDGKVVYTSTPTIGGADVTVDEHGLERWDDAEDCASPIWRLWQEGTRHEWAWPCPECGEYFIPRFRLLWWPDDSTPAQAKREARLICPHCGAMIEDAHKTNMNERGVYVAPGQSIDRDGVVHGDPPESETKSFWVSGLASPWRTWGQRAHQYLSAVRAGDQSRIQTAVNTGFGELFRVSGDAPDWQSVAERREPYRLGHVPRGVQIVTAGVDVQKDRLYYVVRGWGHRSESWLIDHGELWGETEQDEVWADLGGLLQSRYGDDLPIRVMLVDSGYRPGRDKVRRPQNQIYAFCRRHQGHAFPAKGHDTQERPIRKSRIDVTLGGRTIKQGLMLMHLDSDHYKSWVHTRLEWPVTEPGAFHIAEDATEDYCQQLVAESRAVKPSGHVVWIQQRKDNHYLDAEYLARAAAELLNVDQLGPAPEPRASEKSRPARRQQSGWMNHRGNWMGR